MSFQGLTCLVSVVTMTTTAWATPPTPVLRYVFDTTGTQRDLGIAPTANGTLSGGATTAYNSPLSFSCRSLDLSAGGSGYVTTGADINKLDALPALTATFWVNLRAAPAVDDCFLSDSPSGIPPSGQGGWEIRVGSGGTPTANNFQMSFGVSRSTGSVLNEVGQACSAAGQEAALWRSGQAVGLGVVPGGARTSVAYGVSARGSYVVGYGGTTSSTQRAFIWDRQHGARDLKTALETDYALDLTGWVLTYAVGVSDDGSIIAGSGTNPAGLNEAWIARLPVPPTIADFNGDGHVDGTDADQFAACATGPGVTYGLATVPAGCPMALDVLGLLAADFDWDHDVDLDDFATFQLCFSGPDSDPPAACRG